MSWKKTALKKIYDTRDRIDDSVAMVELVSLGLVTYESHNAPARLTPKGLAIVLVSDEYDYFVWHPQNGMVSVSVIECHKNTWIVKNCKDCSPWPCPVEDIYMRPKHGFDP